MVEEWADQNHENLFEKTGVISQTASVSTGLPEAVKAPLEETLAERCGLKWRTIYWREIKEAPYPFKPGRIYENIRLIRTQDMEQFDWVIYVDCSTEDAKTRVISRDRDAALVDLVEFYPG